jgi:sugar phosphate isomerase/epimerase
MNNRKSIFFLLVLLVLLVVPEGCVDPKTNYGIFEGHGDIGACALEGDLSYDMDKDEYLITGSGENIWFEKDQFHYAWFGEEEDIGMRAKIRFIGEGRNAHRKAGWMFRSSLDSTAAHVSATIHGDGLTGIQYRPEQGEDMQEVKSDAGGPLYIQFTKKGNTYELITGTSEGITDTVLLEVSAIPEQYYAGLFICSHDNTVKERAIFSRVEVWDTGDPGIVPFETYVNEDKNEPDMLAQEKMIAWCIVPFDANERTPVERAGMLKELGISKLAYDYRDRHIPRFAEEIRVMKEAGIDISAVWLWIQDGGDQLLDPASEQIVRTVEDAGLETAFWISFPDTFFEGLSDGEKLQKAAGTLNKLNERVEPAGCSIALYNHGDWFGNPENQIRIIEEIGSDNIGIVYNFHHAHHEVDRFGELFPKMMPYLTAVNLNGMTVDGPKIIDLGKGEEELRMLKIMQEHGYTGPIGILGHTEGEDIKVVLERNLEGLDQLRDSLQGS